MSSPFVAEIRIVGFDFAPTGWAKCDGQLLPLSQNTALFSLLGTYYGGDGKSTFALPNFRGSVAVGQFQGPGLSDRFLGEVSGTDQVTLLQSEIAPHTHAVQAVTLPGNLSSPSPTAALARSKGGNTYAPAASLVSMAYESVSLAGGSLPHNNMMPYLTLNFIIALQGVFPPRG